MNVNQAARALSRANSGLIQPGICFDVSHGEHCDEAIAELFYACNIPAAVAEHPKFIKVVKALRALTTLMNLGCSATAAGMLQA